MSKNKFVQYDPTQVIVTIPGHTVRGFADGSMIKAEFDQDQNTVYIGTKGEGRFVKSANRSGTVTIRLGSFSPSNGIIAGFELADLPFFIKVGDKNSNFDKFFADSCKVKKIPAYEKGKEETENEWVFSFIYGQIFHTGARTL